MFPYLFACRQPDLFAVLQANAKPAKQAPANPAAKGKPAKKGKGGPSFGLGKGTAITRAFVNDAISQQAQGAAHTDSTDEQSQEGETARKLHCVSCTCTSKLSSLLHHILAIIAAC